MLKDIYNYAVVVNNNLHYIHWKSCGSRFDRIHAIANEYYEKLTDDIDDIVELAVEHDEDILNPNECSTVVDISLSYGNFGDFEKAMIEMSLNIQSLIDVIEKTQQEGYDSDVVSYLDELLRYWKKELNFKMKKRLQDA